MGALSQNFPMVSFQEQQNEAVMKRLVTVLQPYLTAPDTPGKDDAKPTSKDHKSHSFQVRGSCM